MDYLLEVMGIPDISKTPAGNTPPTAISIEATVIWEDFFQSKQTDAIPHLSFINPRKGWILAMQEVYNKCIELKVPWADRYVSSNAAKETFYKKLLTRRRKLVGLYERMGWLYNKQRGVEGTMMWNINFYKLGSFKTFTAIPLDNNQVNFIVYRRIELPKNDDREEFERLIKHYDLLFRGKRRALIRPQIPNTKTGFRLNEFNKLEYFLDMILETDFVPKELMKPIPTLGEYSKYMVDMYMKAIADKRIMNKYLGALDL